MNQTVSSFPTVLHGPFADLAGRYLAGRVLAEARKLAGGDREVRHIALLEHGRFGNVIGGSAAIVVEGWMHLEWLWVKPAHRRKGIGARLLDRTEETALRHGAHSAWLWTMSFEAPGFYAKQGYEPFMQLDNCGAKRHQRIGYRKQLRPILATPDLSEATN